MSYVVVLRRAASLAVVSVSSFLLSSCGGGGGGGSPSTATAAVGVASTFAAAQSVANICTPEGQKQWVRSFMDETYLWHDEIRDTSAGNYATPNSYYDSLLVRTLDANGVVKDRFSTSMSTTSANVMQGVSAAADAAAMTSNADPVPLSKIVTTGTGRRVGYILFNEHKQGAQDKLVDAVTQLRDGAVQDLVLDLRYNPGGFLYIAQSLGTMVAGRAAQGQVYQQLLYSDKRSALNETLPFSTTVTSSETTYTIGMELPQLNLPRLYVLSSRLTCSASETIISSLRGVGIEVVLVGDRTCGKPYGFHRKDNCGQAFFPVEFRVANAAGFSDYSAGFPVQCKVAENPLKALGDTSEPLLAAALRHIDTGSCPVTNATGVLVAQSASSSTALDRDNAPPADSPMYQAGYNGMQR